MRKLLVFLLMGVFLISLAYSQAIPGPTFQGSTQNEVGGGSSYSSTIVQHATPGYGVSPRSVGVNNFFGLDNGQAYEYCQERQDFIIQIAPGGCTPQVVRSDLLAEQNVPIFCELQAIQINPVLETSSIQNIVLTSEGVQDPVISGISYQRPNSALRKEISSQGFTAIDNLGYAVILLKGGMPENQMPEFVNGTLSARVQYDAVNAFGFGLQEHILNVLSEEEWQRDYVKYGFFDGQAYVRLERDDGDKITVGIYSDVDHKIDSFVVEKGQTSSEKYLAASYCNAGYSVSYVEGKKPEVKAKFVLDSDSYDVYDEGTFGEGLCKVNSINSKVVGGDVTVTCGKKSYTLKLESKPVSFVINSQQRDLKIGNIVGDKSESGKSVYFAGIGKYSKSSEKEGLFALFALTDKIEGNYQSQIDLFSGGKEDDSNFKSVSIGLNKDVFGVNVEFVNTEELVDSELDTKTQNYFEDALNQYKEIEDIYDGGENSKIDGEFAGKKALKSAVELSEKLNKDATQLELINEIREKYEEEVFEGSLTSSRFLNRDKANLNFEVDGITHYLILKSIEEPNRDEINVRLSIDGTEKRNLQDVGYVLGNRTDDVNIYLVDFDSEKVVLDGNCVGDKTEKRIEIKLGNDRLICDHKISVENINFEQEVTIKLNPVNKKLGGKVNFSYGIGIEKRAIELTPEKSLKRIEKLNQSIAKWEDLNQGLEDVVEGMKAACFATTAALQVKNLFSGMGGKAIARQMVMQEKWNKKCQEDIDQYNSLDDCYSKNANKINADVNLYTEIINEQQVDIRANDDRFPLEGVKGGIFGSGNTVDYDGAFNSYKESMLNRYSDDPEILDAEGGNGVKLSEALEGVSDYETLRRIDLQLRIRNEINVESDSLLYENTRETLYDDLNIARERIVNSKVPEGFSEILGEGLSFSGEEVQYFGNNPNAKPARYNGEVIRSASNPYILPEGTRYEPIKINGKNYIVVLEETTSGNQFSMRDVYSVETKDKLDVESNEYGLLQARTKGEFRLFNSESYQNKYTNPKVRFYESEPYKGMPAVVPFDTNNGWYAATKQTLPAFGNTKSFEDSGRVSSFWVCNVGENGREEFNSGIGDDICEKLDLITGQDKNRFPGLDDAESRIIIGNAEKALDQASSQYRPGITQVKILGKTYEVGSPQANIPETQCQNFMSPKDCKLMFNVCDPVICPSSRCDLGGTFPVDSVVQSGIVGSTLLCLPNIKEGIAIPVCLTGIHAGIDNYVSILKASRDCLQDSVDTGRYTGICDEITAIYQCEFFWKQIGPAVNVLLPKLLEGFTGNTPRGGGEYLSVQAAWENTQSSINYFKQTYAEDSFKAFNVRSTAEAGTEICKGFVSTRYPNKFKTLIEADSPTQFTAWFDEIPQSDAVTPAISHYKVFYHIFAGTDSGTQFSVYLKNPEGSSYVQSTGNVAVDTGYISAGDYASETRDFTAPSGFRELCVRTNFQEECGFKQVSTSFALDYVRDKYIENQIDRNDIKTEKECISGTSVLQGGSPLALVNPNLQSGVEEAVTPAIYERGIIRICSTENPGKGVDEQRYTEVGICGNSKIGCWLDESSIDRAITPGHDVTIDVLDESVNNEVNQLIEPEDGAVNNLQSKVESLFGDIGENENNFEGRTRVLFAEMNDLEKLNLDEPERAKVSFLRARVYDALAWFSFLKQPQKEEVSTPKEGDDEVVDGVTGGEVSDELKLKEIFNGVDISVCSSVGGNKEGEFECGHDDYFEISGNTCTGTCLAKLKLETAYVIYQIGSVHPGLKLTGAAETEGHSGDSHKNGLAFDLDDNEAAQNFADEWLASERSSSSNPIAAFVLSLFRRDLSLSPTFENKYGFPSDAINILYGKVGSESKYAGNIIDAGLDQPGYHFHIEVYLNKIDMSSSSNDDVFLASFNSNDNNIASATCPRNLDVVNLYSSNYALTSPLLLGPPSSLEQQNTPIVVDVAEEHGFNPNLIKAIVRTESTWDHLATNPKSSAKGLMQILDATFGDIKDRKVSSCIGINDDDSLGELFNPETNVRYGTCYLKIIEEKNKLEKTGLIIAAFKWGPGNVKRACTGDTLDTCNLNTETQEYVDKVFEYYNEYNGCS